MGLTIKDLKL